MRRMYGALVLAVMASAACGGGETPPPKVPETTAVTTPPPPPPAPTATVEAPPPPAKAPLADLIRKNEGDFIKALMAHDAKAVGATYADNAVSTMYGAPASVSGKDAITSTWQKQFDAFPDMKGGASRIFHTKDVVITEWAVNATHKGEFFGIKGTDKPIGFSGVTVTWFNDEGMRKEEHVYWDVGTVMSQIGVSKMKARPIPALPTKPEMFTVQNTDAEKKNLEVGKAAYAAMEGKGDLKAFLATMDEKVDWDDMTQPATMKGRGEAEKWFTAMHKGFSDGKMATKNAWAFGDYIVVESEFTGTHTGEFMGAKPTKKAINFHGLDIVQAKDGKAVHGWWYANGAEAAMQLGLMKPPGDAKAADPKAAPKADAPKADPKAAPKK